MEELTIEEILNIISSYSKAGADYMALGRAYSVLSSVGIIKKEKESNKEKEIKERILAIISGKKEKERHLGEDVKEWCLSTVGEWNINQLFSELCLTTKQNKDTAKQMVRWLVSKNTLEHVGSRSGIYRKVINEYEEQRWWEDEGKASPVRFPLNMHDLVKILPGSAILLEGQKSQGKTSFGLEFARLNRFVYPDQRVRYLNVEMSDGEIAERIRNYQASDMWTVEDAQKEIEFVKRYADWADLINPDGLTVIDYVRDSLESYKISHYIELIHAKLRNGIAFIIVQRDPNKVYGAGGYNIRSIPRLVISLQNHICKIEDTKHFWRPPNPSGMAIRYKLAGNGVKWLKEKNCDWEQEEKITKKDKFKGIIDPDVKKEGGYL